MRHSTRCCNSALFAVVVVFVRLPIAVVVVVVVIGNMFGRAP